MPFMQPDYQPGPFVRVENEHGESCLVPAGYENPQPGDTCEVEGDATSVFVRLSAPGYMDATEWDGPFATLEEARDHVRDLYDVDPDSGEDLDDGDE